MENPKQAIQENPTTTGDCWLVVLWSCLIRIWCVLLKKTKLWLLWNWLIRLWCALLSKTKVCSLFHRLKDGWLRFVNCPPVFKLRALWNWLAQPKQRFPRYFLIGVLAEIVLLLGHWLPIPWVIEKENWVLDPMMRVHALWDQAPRGGVTPPLQMFIDVDDATWRSDLWGGGEPYRAPRKPMIELIKKSFELGASQVVLDIVVEGSGKRAREKMEDEMFATGLTDMLDRNIIGERQQLVLVRSLRSPLPPSASADDRRWQASISPASTGYLNELRESAEVDAVVAKSKGRIVVAAPYFTYSGDRVLRDWQLFQVICERDKEGALGKLRIVPSVQIAVLAKYVGLPNSYLAWGGDSVQPANQSLPARKGCIPFPREEFPHETEYTSGQFAYLEKGVKGITQEYWDRLRSAFLSKGIKLGDALPRSGELGNRVVFRWMEGSPVVTPVVGPNGHTWGAPRTKIVDPYLSLGVIPARALLELSVPQDLMSFRNRVVVIGQSHPESGDIHNTPLGDMPGAMVLLNAIDSIARYQLVSSPSLPLTIVFTLVTIIVAAHCFAYCRPFICSMFFLPSLIFASFYLFGYGLWLVFAFPVMFIIIDRITDIPKDWILSRFQSQERSQPP